MIVNPLATIADAVIGSDEKNLPMIWKKRGHSKIFDSIPAKGEECHWKQLSTWQTLRKIESFMLDDNILNDLSITELKSLKKYCVSVTKERYNSFLAFFRNAISFLRNGIKYGCWISTAEKATKILEGVYKQNCIKKGRPYLHYYVPEYEIINTGRYGPSRTYEVKIDGHKDLSAVHKGVGFINGIQNPYEYAKETAEYLASFTGEEIQVDPKVLEPEAQGIIPNLTKFLPTFMQSEEPKQAPEVVKGVHVQAVYNATHSVFADLKASWLGWWGYKTKPTKKIIKMWDKFFTQNEEGKFLMYCHSQGAIHVKHALEIYPEHLRKRIEIVAVGPGVYINPEHCGNVIHLVSDWDFIHLFDWKAAKNVKELKASKNAAFHDHSFRSETFKQYIKESLEAFVKEGTIAGCVDKWLATN